MPRRAKDGVTELPSPRLLSSQMTRETNVADAIHNVFVMQMGQFIDHDITHTPNHGITCCGVNSTFPGNQRLVNGMIVNNIYCCFLKRLF